MTKFERIAIYALSLLLIVATIAVYRHKDDKPIEEEEPAVIEAPAATERFNTSYLEQWDKGESDNTIRMIGAWFYSFEPSNCTYVLEDESGDLWVVRDVSIDEDDFLLLWIDNGGTPDYIEDDLVVKTWKEVR